MLLDGVILVNKFYSILSSITLIIIRVIISSKKIKNNHTLQFNRKESVTIKVPKFKLMNYIVVANDIQTLRNTSLTLVNLFKILNEIQTALCTLNDDKTVRVSNEGDI